MKKRLKPKYKNIIILIISIISIITIANLLIARARQINEMWQKCDNELKRPCMLYDFNLYTKKGGN